MALAFIMASRRISRAGCKEDALNQGTPQPKLWLLVATIALLSIAALLVALYAQRDTSDRPRIGGWYSGIF